MLSARASGGDGGGGAGAAPLRATGDGGRTRPDRSGAILEALVLGAAVALLAPVLIPSHWTSIWMDREFTGTVASIANRLDGSFRLYADGGHIPMPPLPFVLMRLLTGGGATWLWESALNFGFQALTLLLSTLALRRLARPPVPFLAAFVTIPVFFALPKVVLYDSMAQAAVAALVFQAAGSFPLQRAGGPGGGPASAPGLPSRWLRPLAGLALTSAVLLLVKQSTGFGACLGVGLALLGCERSGWRRRLGLAAAYALLTAGCLVVLGVALRPWVDGAGLVRDVFLTGSEPKGGPRRLLADLARFAAEIGRYAALVALPVAALLAAARRAARGRVATFGTSPEGDRTATRPLLAVGAALSAALLLAVATAGPRMPEAVLARTRALALVLWAGLVLAALLSLPRLRPAGPRGFAAIRRPRAFAAVFAIAFPAAAFHALSAHTFRWTYDNNPLVPVAYAALFAATLAALDLIPGRRTRIGAIVLLCLVVAPLRAWARLGDQLLACQRCTERWDEVRFLAGARLPGTAAGMRRLVGEVRRTAAPGEHVLLLPDDPNVEAWFERDHPRLSSLFIFADQYWDRYVDVDFAALANRPPRVIVVGPLAYWRSFHRIHQFGRGAERLIDRVTGELLPALYELDATIPIDYQGGQDAMAVYVRREMAGR